MVAGPSGIALCGGCATASGLLSVYLKIDLGAVLLGAGVATAFTGGFEVDAASIRGPLW